MADSTGDLRIGERIRIEPNHAGLFRCPLCRRICTMPHFVGEHLAHHRYTIDGRQHAELDVEVTVIVRDRYQPPTVTAGAPPE